MVKNIKEKTPGGGRKGLIFTKIGWAPKANYPKRRESLAADEFSRKNINIREPHAFDYRDIPRWRRLGTRGVDSSPAEYINLHGGDERHRAHNTGRGKIKRNRWYDNRK